MTGPEKLIAVREGVSSSLSAAPMKNLLARLERLNPPALCGGLCNFFLLGQTLSGRLRPDNDDQAGAGLLFPVKSTPDAHAYGRMTFAGDRRRFRD